MARRLGAALAVAALIALVGYAQPSIVVVGHSDGPATWMSTEVADAAPDYGAPGIDVGGSFEADGVSGATSAPWLVIRVIRVVRGVGAG